MKIPYILDWFGLGISQIPLLIFLHNNRNLKVDQFDQNGATPLCIVAREGTPAMADVCGTETQQVHYKLCC